MVELEGVAGLLLLGLWLFAIIDVIATDSDLCRNLPKTAWLMIVLIVPDVGATAWLLLGRPEKTTFTPGSTSYRPSRGHVGPEDSPAYLSRSEELDRRLDAWLRERGASALGYASPATNVIANARTDSHRWAIGGESFSFGD